MISGTVTELSAMLVERITCKGKQIIRIIMIIIIKHVLTAHGRIQLFLPSCIQGRGTGTHHSVPPESQWSGEDKPVI